MFGLQSMSMSSCRARRDDDEEEVEEDDCMYEDENEDKGLDEEGEGGEEGEEGEEGKEGEGEEGKEGKEGEEGKEENQSFFGPGMKDAFEHDIFALLRTYFRPNPLRRLVRTQIESYDYFVHTQMQKTIDMFNPVTVWSPHDINETTGKPNLEVVLRIENRRLNPPMIHENSGATKLMMPQEAKLRNFTYASVVTVDVHVTYVVREPGAPERRMEKVLPKVTLCRLPIMVKSSVCVLSQHPQLVVGSGECAMDCGGYFIIKGSEKTVLGQERAAENRIYCFDGKNTTKWSYYAEFKSVPTERCVSPKQIDVLLASKNNGFGHALYVQLPRVKDPLDLFVLFRALGVISDRDICDCILLDALADEQEELLDALAASIVESKQCLTQEDALASITKLVSSSQQGQQPQGQQGQQGQQQGQPYQTKRREFVMDVLENDLFPHCSTVVQKRYLLGHMTKKLLQVSLGWLSTDDRDSYVNKRIELTGTLINNLFRNYYNKLMKEMKKQVVREIQSGSWKSSWRLQEGEERLTSSSLTTSILTTEDYDNILTPMNICKCIKSMTIDNGINKALSTGDFSLKTSNSSKKGVAQVLNHQTYAGTLSHLRRINTPLEKSGELIAPRKLHNSTWGFLCPVETPEGQAIGVVKNLAYMAHVTIPSSARTLARFVEPFLVPLEALPPQAMYKQCKVVINGAWLGITHQPMELYADLKNKKHQGILNMYVSVILDFKAYEVRLCNDGGRLVRPVLRVLRQGTKPGQAKSQLLLSREILDRVVDEELSWNDLLTNCRIPESVIEYVDVEEQAHAMIAIPTKGGEMVRHDVAYTHCEIHPSTVFGVLASCIPFPEHNQAPRNTYQCLDPDTLVPIVTHKEATDFTVTKRLRDIVVGDRVFTVDPVSLAITATEVVGQFVQAPTTDVYEVTTATLHTVLATDDHRFLTDRGWKTVGELRLFPNRWVLVTTSCGSDSLRFTQVRSVKKVDVVTEVACLETASANHSFLVQTQGLAQGLEPAYLVSSNCAMGKQAIGIPSLNQDMRMDRSANVLTYPSAPLVDTQLMNFIGLNEIPSGCQIHVAIMSYTGYNQEDSVLMNGGSIARGLFMASIFHTEKDEDKNVVRDQIIRCKPVKSKTKGIKFGNYDKINEQGFIPENTLVENRDVIIAKVVPLRTNRNDPTKVIKFEDQSKTFRTTEETFVDRNYTGRNGEGYNCAKVRTRVLRKPVYGDKFSSRHGQKGTCGNIVPEKDMPYTASGLRPDIIINPHAIPSRMTIAQLKETLLGKVLVSLGMFGDGTAFGSLDVATIAEALQQCGYESYGNEVMYDGLSGRCLEASVFIGPVFYQRLKHMVNDKQHSRAIGPMMNLTRQPAEGRSRDGGFRVGEMERDVLIAHGMSHFCKERLFDVSDKYTVMVCKRCGLPAPFNNGSGRKWHTTTTMSAFRIARCFTCDNTTEFARVNLPYACKLLFQELFAMNVVPRLVLPPSDV